MKAAGFQRVSAPRIYSARDSAHFDLRFRNFFLPDAALAIGRVMRGRMALACARRSLLLLTMIVFASGCSDEDGTANPGGPSNTPPAQPPPSGVVSVAGNWSGTSDFQQNGRFFPARLTATIRQTDRNVEGTVFFPEPSWSGWQATFSGQLSGNSPESQFFGNVTVNAAPQSGGGTCTGTMQMRGMTRANTLRWEAPILTLRPTGTNAGGTVCLGEVLTVIWILGR